MKLKAKIEPRITLNMDGTENFTFSAPAHTARIMEAEKLLDAEVEIEIKVYRKKRSLDANALAWVMIDRIAQKMNISKTEVYRNAIRDIGGVCTIVCVKKEAVPMLRASWEKHGIGWTVDEMFSKLPGCVTAVLYYGSSMYDSQQMSGLINHLMQDAEALGIPTATPQEIEYALNRWGKEDKKA